MILEIKTFPDEVLRKKSTPVETVDDNIKELLDNMAETMYNAPGIGLAAPQVGVNKRVIVIDITGPEEKSGLMKIVNPEILEMDGEVVGEEGCLSVPEEYAEVKRAEKIKVKFLDENSVEHIIEADGLLARAFQHEIDHLDGVLFIDKISPLKREFIKKRVRKKLKFQKQNS
ncbi:MAG: peptide deformylase [Deferribacteres bacterium]|nr:Peptide deformylase [Deferribacteraceae bacterium]MDK2792243.1 peptide deformylase [Deferribacteres bacterium]